MIDWDPAPTHYECFWDKWYIVTGASGDIGSQVVTLLVSHGAQVCAFGWDHAWLSSLGWGTCKIIIHDFLLEPENLANHVKEAMIYFEGEIDGLIVCHGMM